MGEASREFLIQRYASGNWPEVRGHRPFFVSGPAFRSLVLPESLGEFEYRFHTALSGALASLPESPEWRDVAAEWLLREGIVEALWSSDVTTCLPPEQWWDVSVAELSTQIPGDEPVVDATVEFLSGISDASYYRGYLSEDGLELTPCPVP